MSAEEEPPSAPASAAMPRYDFSRPPYLTQVSKEFSEGNLKGNFLKGCKWAPDGSCVLTNSADNSLRFLNAPDLSSLPTEPQPWTSVLQIKEVDLVYDYCWYPKMSSLVPATCCILSTARTAPIHLWDAFSGTLRASYIGKDNADAVMAARCVAVDPAGEVIYAGFPNSVRLFVISCPGDECAKINLKRKDGHQGGIISCIAFDPSGVDLVAFGSYNRSLGIYTSDGELVTQMEGHNSGITHVKFSCDGRRVFSGARMDSSIICWDLRMAKELYRLHRPVDTNQRVYFDVDGSDTSFVSGQSNGSVGIWNLTEDRSPEPDFSYPLHNDMVNGVSYHPLWPVFASSSGQRHVPEYAQDESAVVPAVKAEENSLKLWYVG